MENYQELYNKILDELKILEVNDSSLKQELDNAKKDYDGIQQQIVEVGKTLVSLVQKKDLLMKSKMEKINVILLTILSVLFMLSFVLNLVILTPVILWINTLIEMTDFGLSVLSIGFYLLSILLSTVLNVCLFKKMNNFLVDRTYTKTINSKEYKEIMNQIDETKNMKQSLVLDEIGKKYAFEMAEEKYNISIEEINKRKEFLDYIKYELNKDDNKVGMSKGVKVKSKKK